MEKQETGCPLDASVAPEIGTRRHASQRHDITLHESPWCAGEDPFDAGRREAEDSHVAAARRRGRTVPGSSRSPRRTQSTPAGEKPAQADMGVAKPGLTGVGGGRRLSGCLSPVCYKVQSVISLLPFSTNIGKVLSSTQAGLAHTCGLQFGYENGPV